jgi:hypothetical protein
VRCDGVPDKTEPAELPRACAEGVPHVSCLLSDDVRHAIADRMVGGGTAVAGGGGTECLAYRSQRGESISNLTSLGLNQVEQFDR